MAGADVGGCGSSLTTSPPRGQRMPRSRLAGILNPAVLGLLALLGSLLALGSFCTDLRVVRMGEAAPATHASKPVLSSVAAPAPTKVGVGVWLLRVGDVNIATETYDMDLYLIFDCDRPCHPNNFEVMNGREITRDRKSVV